MADMANAVRIITFTDPNDTELWIPDRQRKLYVLGPTQTDEDARVNIVREMPLNHPMLRLRSPL